MSLLLPKVRAPVPKRPSYEVLNMAFGVGAGATLFDKSRYRSHGTITTASWAAGLHGYCLDFNPANPDYVAIPAAHTQLDFTSEDFSLIARVYIDDLTAIRTIFNRGQRNNDGYHLWVHNNGRLMFETSQALALQTSHSCIGSVVTLAWYTIGCSRTGASARLYLNGVEDTLVAAVHINPLTSARNTAIGISSDLVTWPVDGKIEFLRIFRGIALATSEHLAWHRALA